MGCSLPSFSLFRPAHTRSSVVLRLSRSAPLFPQFFLFAILHFADLHSEALPPIDSLCATPSPDAWAPYLFIVAPFGNSCPTSRGSAVLYFLPSRSVCSRLCYPAVCFIITRFLCVRRPAARLPTAAAAPDFGAARTGECTAEQNIIRFFRFGIDK